MSIALHPTIDASAQISQNYPDYAPAVPKILQMSKPWAETQSRALEATRLGIAIGWSVIEQGVRRGLDFNSQLRSYPAVPPAMIELRPDVLEGTRRRVALLEDEAPGRIFSAEYDALSNSMLTAESSTATKVRLGQITVELWASGELPYGDSLVGVTPDQAWALDNHGALIAL